MGFELVMPKDLRIEVYVDPVTWMALKKRVDDVDRTLSQHIRHLIRVDLETASSDLAREGRVMKGETEAESV
jgi:hypothetical protein